MFKGKNLEEISKYFKNPNLTNEDIINLHEKNPRLVEEAFIDAYMLLNLLYYPDINFCKEYNLDFYDKFNINNFIILINGYIKRLQDN